ncbi:GntR family transcriptional regulator [bacterium]|nr:MAG: GntR family transcriptional regulator [bacterium]
MDFHAGPAYVTRPRNGAASAALAPLAERRRTLRPEGLAAHSLSSAVVVPPLREAIIEGQLPPGTRLSESELAQELGVSRTPVREALAQLERDGLVTIVARAGAFVRTVTIDDLNEIYETRIALETFAVQLVAQRLTPVGRARLEEVLARMRERVAGDDHAGYTAELDRYYAVVMELAGNATLARIHEAVLVPVRRLRRIAMSHENRMAESLLHAEKIAAAMLAGDSAGAAAEMREQLVTACQAAQDVLLHAPPRKG